MIKKILALTWNELKIEFAYKSTLVFFLILPIAFTTLIGLAMGNTFGGKSDADPRIALMVVNLDEGQLGDDVLTTLETSQMLRPVLKSAQEASELFEEGSGALFIIPENFSETLMDNQELELSLQVPENNTTATGLKNELEYLLHQIDSAIVIAYQTTEMMNKEQPFASEAEREVFFNESLNSAEELLANPAITTRFVNGSAGEEAIIPNGYAQSSPGQLVTWVLTTLMGGSIIFVNERNQGTLRRLMSSPTSKGTILLGKILGRLTMGIVQMVLLIGFGVLVLGVNWGSSFLGLAVLLLSFGLAGTAMGVMLGAFARTSSQANGLSTLFSMLLAALGGAWWPLEITPAAYQTVVKALPSTWAMIGFSDLITRGQGLTTILPEAGILLLFAAVFFTIGYFKLSYE